MGILKIFQVFVPYFNHQIEAIISTVQYDIWWRFAEKEGSCVQVRVLSTGSGAEYVFGWRS